MNKLYEKLDAAVLEFAQENKSLCLEKYPGTKFKVQREKCLTGSWDTIEAKAAAKTIKDPMCSSLDLNLMSLKNRARLNRTRNQQALKN